MASTASNRKGAKIHHDKSWFYQIFFSKTFKLNSRTCMTLKCSVVIFQALEPLRPQWPLQPHFIKNKILLLMVGYSLATKWPIQVLFCGMDHQKPKFSLISVPFLLEAFEVSRCYFFENWLMKLKYPNLRISKPPSNKFYLAFFYLSESIHKILFNMR